MVVRYLGEIPSSIPSDLYATCDSADYYFDVDCEANGDLFGIVVEVEPVQNTVFMTKFIDLQELLGGADVDGTKSMLRVVNFFYGRLTVSTAGYFLFNDTSQPTAEVAKEQFKDSFLVAQLSSVTSNCHVWPSPLGERGTEITNLKTFSAMLKLES